MNINDIFRSEYMTAADLKGREWTLTISALSLKEFKNKDGKTEHKIIVSFLNAQRAFVANRTNAMTIADMYGDETDGWIGKPITIYPTKVDAFGQMTLTIRVKHVTMAQRAAAMQAPLAHDEPPPHVDIPDNVPPPRANGNGSYAAAKNGVKLPMATAAGIDDEIPF